MDAPLPLVTISGVDLSRPLGADVQAEVIQAFYDHLVIFFPDQPGLTPEMHVRFAQLFGSLQRIPHLHSISLSRARDHGRRYSRMT